MSKLLVTGGAGYIGSHMALELLQNGHDVTVLDNFSNSSPAALEALQRIAQRQLTVVQADLRDRATLDTVFADNDFDAVLHFAGLKAVGESIARPLEYYENNVNGSLALVEAMGRHGVTTLVFSSSATVYGMPERVPIDEDFPLGPINPYGRSKLHVEHILSDLCAAEPDWRISILRYFNPVGAHPSGEIGEDPNGVPNNLMPYIAQVAVGRLPRLQVFGDDYPTPDGTGVRDYIHVVDLVRGHLKALEYLADRPGCHTFNLGTGTGYSVLEMIRAFELASGQPVPFEVTARRPGDAAVSYANPARAEAELGWRATHDLETMCRDVWRWQNRHPTGYRDT